MKAIKYSYYPKLRRAFKNALEISDVINRSEVYVWQRLSHPEKWSFTFTEKRLILNFLNVPFNSTSLEEYFGTEETKNA